MYNVKSLELTAVFVKIDGGHAAHVAEISGINTQGETLQEAKENLIDAYKVMMEYRRDKAAKEHPTGLFTFNPLLASYDEKTSSH